jgi:soluble lytic murein transglycosylase
MTNVCAQPALADDQRAMFVALEKQISTTPYGQLASLDGDIAALADYPLYPYLLRAKLYRQLNMAHADEITQFLHTYGSQPVSRALRIRWLKYVAEQKDAEKFLQAYQPKLGVDLQCEYLNFVLASSSQPQPIYATTTQLWQHGYSRPKACDPLFSQWQRAGFMTIDVILNRVEKVGKGGDVGLFNYLKRRLPEPYQYLVDLWRDVKRKPSIVLQGNRFPLTHVQRESTVLSHGLVRLAWLTPKAAIKGWYQWQHKAAFSDEDIRQIHRAIALSLAIDNDPLAEEWLARANVPAAMADVRHWHLAYMLRHADWEGALAVIENAPTAEQEQGAFRFWQGRSYGQLNGVEKQQSLLTQLAQERNYYGFLASAQLQTKPQLTNQPLVVAPELLSQLASRGGAQRAFEFFKLERFIDARREWRSFVMPLSATNKQAAAVLASEWGWHDQAIIGFIQGGYLDDVERRFPLAYAPQITREAENNQIDPAFAMAIARRESSFMVDAVSPAGARGLMQLMPSTVRYLSKEKVSNRSLFDPNKNLAYGMQYLRYLMDKLDNNPVLVLASYNAGWKRVMEWLPQEQSQPMDIWIENIPYKETRHYVKAVMAYRYIYQWQMGKQPTLFDSLINTQIKADNLIVQP